MRVTSIDLLSNESEWLRLSLRGSDSGAKYQVIGVTVLDADEIVPSFYGFGTVTSAKYYNMKLRNREIAMRIGLNPNYRVSESNSNIRDDIYKAVSASRTGTIKLHFNSGATTVAAISGFITKIEVPYFDSTSEVTVTLSCSDPMFRAINAVILEADDLSTGTPIMVADSMSTAPHGFEMEFVVSAPFASFVMRNSDNEDWQFELFPGVLGAGTGFIAGDIFTFNSEFLSKKLCITRGANVYHLADKVSTASLWPVIFPGANEFHVTNSDKFAWNYIRYYPAYWGV